MMKNATYNTIVSLIMIFSITLISSCKKESVNLCGEEYLGEMFLLESSRNSIPYIENTNLYFQDSLGNEIVLVVDMNNTGYKIEDGKYIIACEQDNSQQKEYGITTDSYRYLIVEKYDTLNILYSLTLEVRPSYTPFTIDSLADIIKVCSGSKFDTNSYSFGCNLTILVNPRNMKEKDLNWFQKNRKPVDELTLLNKTFQNVYISQLDSNEFYNFEYGLIAFKDSDKKLWVLDRLEKVN